MFWKKQDMKFFSDVRNNSKWNASFTGIYQPPSTPPLFRCWLWGTSGAALSCARHCMLQHSLSDSCDCACTSPGWWAKLLLSLAAFPILLPSKAPFELRNLPSVGNAGLRISCDRHCNPSSLHAKINVSRNLDKSLTVSNARNVPYFLFHYEKWFYLDFSEIQCDCSFN